MRVLPIILYGLVLLNACGSRRELGETSLPYGQLLNFNEAYFSGASHKVQGNYGKAIEEFQLALKINPAAHEVMYQLGNLYFKNQQINEAIHWAEQAVRRNPSFNFWYCGQLAQMYSKAGQFQKSADVFEIMIAEQPEKENNYIEIANQYLNLQQPREAIKWLDGCEKKMGYRENIIRKKEEIFLKLGDYDKAAAEIQKLLLSDPENTRYLGLLAEIFIQGKQYSEAETYYLKILEIDPINGYACFGMADMLRKKGQADKSFDYLKLGFGDDRVPLHTKLQVITSYYFLLKRDEKSRTQAFELGEVILKTHPEDALSSLMYGDLLLAIGEISEARKYYLNSLEIDPSDYRIWEKLFGMDQQLMNPQLLEQDTRKALEYFPSQAELYILHAYALMEQNQFNEAMEMAIEGQVYAIEGADKTEFKMILAECYHQIGEYKKSAELFEQLLLENANNALVLNNYAYFLSEQGTQLEKALELSMRSLNIDPNNASYLDTYGWILFKLSRYTEAEVYIKRALEGAGMQSADVLEHYGDVLFQLNRPEEAINYWKQAREAGKKNPELDQKIKLQQL